MQVNFLGPDFSDFRPGVSEEVQSGLIDVQELPLPGRNVDRIPGLLKEGAISL